MNSRNPIRLAVVSNVGGAAWAGSEELWYETACLHTQEGGFLRAVLNPQIADGSRCRYLAKRGGEVHAWTRATFPAMEPVRQWVNPSFTARKLGYPDVILVSCGSLPALTYVPGLTEYLLSSACCPFLLLCQFNAETVPFSASERATVRKLFQRARHSVFVSSDNLALARRQLALDLPHASVIPNPIRFDLDEPLPFPSMESGVKMACVARLESAWKGQAKLIDLLSSPHWRDRPWELSFFGEGRDGEYLRQCVDFHGLNGKVVFRGYVRDVRQIWASHHLMVAPSAGEGMSLAMLEAMMCGRPVVTSDVGGVAECIESGVTGFIGGRSAADLFDAALEEAWSHRLRWEKMGIKAHRRAKEIAQVDPARELLNLIRIADEGTPTS